MSTERTFWRFRRENAKEEPTPEQKRIYALGRRTYLAWHIIEGQNRDIIDFDLINPQNPGSLVHLTADMKRGAATIVERHRIVSNLQGLQQEFKSVPPDQIKERHNWEFAQDQVNASVWFARRLRGDRLNPREYIENTMGVGLEDEIVPDDLIQKQKDLVINLARQLGIGDLDELSLTGFKYDHQLNPPEAKQALEHACEQLKLRLEHFLKDESFDYPFQVEEANVDAYWSAWSMTDPKTGGFLLRQNFFNRVWTAGKTEELGAHERHHINRMGVRQRRIREGDLNQFFGLTTVHGPESPVEEGLAQTITFFIPNAYENLSTEGKFQVEMTLYRQLVYLDAHIKLNSGQAVDRSDIAREVKKRIPWENQREIDQQLEWRTQHKLNQTYLLAYGVGAHHFMRYAEILNQQGREEFLKSLFAKPYTLKQTDALVEKLSQNPRYIKKGDLQSYTDYFQASAGAN